MPGLGGVEGSPVLVVTFLRRKREAAHVRVLNADTCGVLKAKAAVSAPPRRRGWCHAPLAAVPRPLIRPAAH